MEETNGSRSRLLAALRDDGPASRVDLGERLGVQRTRLAAELAGLEQLGLVEPAGHAASRGGRRSTMVRLADDLRLIGVDVGATSIDVAVTDARCEVLVQLSEPCDIRQGPTPVLARVLAMTAQVLQRGPGRLVGVGIGVPGPVSFREGMLVAPPIMPGWDRFPVRDHLASRLGCPVVVDNDVNVMALGERHAGVARSQDDFVFVKVGTGIGCGIVVQGQVYRGVQGAAGDIGHIRLAEDGPVCSCGETGCLEAYFGGAALARDATALARAGRSTVLAELLKTNRRLAATDVATAVAAGDPVSVGLVRDGGRRLGQVIASLVSFFNPGMVVIGGGVAQLGHQLLSEVRSVVYRRSLPLATGNLPIVLSELEGKAGVIGAAWSASDRAFQAVAAGTATNL